MAKKSKDEVTLVTGDGRRYRIIGKVAKIVTTRDPAHTTLFGVFEPDLSMGFRVREVNGRAK